MRQTVIGFFDSATDAQRAEDRLREAGFTEQDIDVSIGNSERSSAAGSTPYEVSDESRYSGSDRYNEPARPDVLNEEKIRQRRDDRDDDNFGDSIGRFFRNLFDNKQDAERYARVGRSSSIVSVYAESSVQAERARDILDECGAFDVDERASSLYTERTGSYTDTVDSDDSTVQSTSNETDVRTTDSTYEDRDRMNPDGVSERSIPVIEENINVGKREVSTGGVRLRSRIFERPVEENLRLREERVRVERVPADRPATDSDFETFREGEIEITETSEVPIVNKEARVVEEVKLTKDVNQREETVRDKVRKTDVEIENLSEEERKSRKKR